MADEPNKTEEELKRYASERRAQAREALHAATRRVLQGEVGRIYGRERGVGGVSWLKRVLLAPRFAWAVSLVAILGISFLVMQRPAPRSEGEAGPRLKGEKLQELKPEEITQRREDAKTQREEKKETIERDSPKAADAVIQSVTATTPIPAPKPNMATAPPANTAAPMPAGEVPLRSMTELARQVEVATGARGMAAAAPAPAKDEKAFSFLNQAPQTKAKTAAKPVEVLTRFNMQQTGSQLQIDDADGSKYAGPVVAQRTGTNLFNVSGMNRTLQQPVVFKGQFYRMPEQQQQVRLAQAQVRVQGQAVVGRTNQVQVDAQAPAPIK